MQSVLPDIFLRRRSAYLVNPVFDLLFVSGGLVPIVVGLCLYASGGSISSGKEQPMAIALSLMAAILFAQPHSAATLFRLFGEAENRKRFPHLVIWLPALLVVIGTVALYSSDVLSAMTSLYLLLMIHHTWMQSYGVVKVYCGRFGYQMERIDERLLKALVWINIVTSAMQLFSPGWRRESFHGVTALWSELFPPEMVFCGRFISFAVLCIILARQANNFRQSKLTMPLPAVATLFFTVVIFSLNRAVSEYIWLFIPALFHGSQYLCFSLALYLNQRREFGLRPIDKREAVEALSSRYLELIISGLALFWLIPWLLSINGFSFVVTSAILFLTVSLHHFAADACLWKLRDRGNASLMTSMATLD